MMSLWSSTNLISVREKTNHTGYRKYTVYCIGLYWFDVTPLTFCFQYFLQEDFLCDIYEVPHVSKTPDTSRWTTPADIFGTFQNCMPCHDTLKIRHFMSMMKRILLDICQQAILKSIHYKSFHVTSVSAVSEISKKHRLAFTMKMNAKFTFRTSVEKLHLEIGKSSYMAIAGYCDTCSTWYIYHLGVFIIVHLSLAYN